MGGLEFEGDLKDINERQLSYIRTVLEDRGYKDKKVLIEAVGKAGDNYVANVKRIIVEDDNGGKFKMVAKVAPSQEVLRMAANTKMLFRNEHIMYTRVLPKLVQLQESKDVPVEDRFRYAICYGSLDEVPNEVILLEDLKESKFEMLDRFQSLSDECVKSVLKNFATLHSLSFVLKNIEPETFEEYTSSLFDLWASFCEVEEMKLYFGQLEKNALMVLESDIHKKAVKGIMSESLQTFAELARTVKDSKHVVIQQGDSWSNNIMFKFAGEKLTQSIMIDYQLSRPSSPTCDLLYMIFNGTDYKTRKEHFHDWIDYYHTELDNALSIYGLKATSIYPKNLFEIDLKKHGKTTFCLAIVLASMLSIKSEDASKLREALESNDPAQLVNSNNILNLDPETIALFKSKVEGLIDSYHEFGLM